LSLAAESAESVLAATPDVDEPMPTDAEVEEAVKAPLREMVSGVRAIVSQLQAIGALSDDVSLLIDATSTVENYRVRPPAEWRDLWLDGAVRINSIIARVAPGVVARSHYRPVLAAAEHVGRITALATLRIARDAILAVDTPVAALREYITSGTRAPEPRSRVRLQDRVNIAIRNLSRFASIRRVRIEFDGGASTYVVAAAGAITRALGNLLHNAIKYSWKREDDRTWVRVTVSQDDTHAIVTFENWGVPIPSEEIDEKLLFQLGFRGRLSSDRGRMGTGVGLPDSLRVAEAHDGAIEIQSRPARTGGDPTDFNQPFVTTVSIRVALVPQSRKGKG
jgi:signal transduction histidine kinase